MLFRSELNLERADGSLFSIRSKALVNAAGPWVAKFIKDDFEVLIAGGNVRRDGGIVGQASVDFINQFKFDFALVGISGIDSDGSLLDFDYQEVRVSQAIIANARQVILAADSSKSLGQFSSTLTNRRICTRS